MSKENLEKHIATVQKQLIKIKEKAPKYVPGTINLQILGCGANGAPASIYLFTDQSRYFSSISSQKYCCYHSKRLFVSDICSTVVKVHSAWHMNIEPN